MNRRPLARTVLVAVVAAVVATTSGCESLKAQKVDLFVRRAPGISAERRQLDVGETLLRVRNDRRSESRIVVVRLHSDTDRLPVGPDDVVPVGSAADVEFEGDGYTVVAKPDDLAPYFANANTRRVVHVHLKRGRYMVFSNFPGDYADGYRVELEVG